ncbi:MAG TPA: polysaccharide deacetylase family protein [Firmicutes bacterium]|nr:polysaccharide deacetylase family protein [Candidatus Fermentithermobacillaceae bacterium]
MVIYLRPGSRRRMAIFAALILVVLGVRVGVSLPGEQETHAKINPLEKVSTQKPLFGVVVDVITAGVEQVTQCAAFLEGLGIKATWFINATFVEAQPDIVKDMAAAGHEFGVKGTDEKPMHKLSSVEAKDRITRSRQALSKSSLDPAPFMLPPGQKYSDVLVQAAFQEGFHAVKPGILATKMKGKEEEAAKDLAGQVERGDIVLIRLENKGMVPKEAYFVRFLTYLSERGLSPATLSDLVRSIE